MQKQPPMKCFKHVLSFQFRAFESADILPISKRSVLQEFKEHNDLKHTFKDAPSNGLFESTHYEIKCLDNPENLSRKQFEASKYYHRDHVLSYDETMKRLGVSYLDRFVNSLKHAFK